jgi:hypothetical protein
MIRAATGIGILVADQATNKGLFEDAFSLAVN